MVVPFGAQTPEPELGSCPCRLRVRTRLRARAAFGLAQLRGGVVMQSADRHENVRELWLLEGDPSERLKLRQVLEPRWDLRFFGRLANLEDAVGSPGSGRTVADSNVPAGLLLELAVPDGNAFRRVIDRDSSLSRGLLDRVPWMVVSATADLDTMRACLREGASDYLTRPWHPSELLIRVERMVGGHGLGGSKAGVRGGDFDWEESLTPKEKRIFSVFREARGSAVTRGELTARVWRDVKVSPNGLDVHLSRLRLKVEPHGWSIRALKGGEGWVLEGRSHPGA